MRWNLEDIAWRERRKGKRVSLIVSYSKMQIDGKWWRWVEDEERLKDEEGRIWEEQGEGQEEVRMEEG